MRVRVIRRELALIFIPATLFGLGLIGVNAIWPKAFAVFVATGGAIGALMVLYQAGLTKRIAEAEFIRDLQTGFTTDPNIGALWRKLLLKEKVTATDRPLISNYLTFFETIHLLLRKTAVELRLIDDLFRNRFFTAIGDEGVLNHALIAQAGAFANVHDLIATWHDYLLANEVPIHAGYYRYIKALTEAKGFRIVQLGDEDLPALMQLQQRVLDDLGDKPWLRANSEVMLKECLTNQVTMGVRKDHELVAAAVLYDGGLGEENIKKYSTDEPESLKQAINLKLVLALPDYRRAGLARTLVELLEQRATELGKSEIMCTIHARNVPSRELFTQLGYERIGQAKTEYGRRDVFSRKIPTLKKRWAR